MIRYDPYNDRFVDTDKATEVITTDRTICENPYFGKVQQSGTMWKPKPQTNADRIRAMSDEELAEFLDRWELKDIDYSKTFCSMCKGQYDCHNDCLMEWLKKEVDG